MFPLEQKFNIVFFVVAYLTIDLISTKDDFVLLLREGKCFTLEIGSKKKKNPEDINT